MKSEKARRGRALCRRSRARQSWPARDARRPGPGVSGPDCHRSLPRLRPGSARPVPPTRWREMSLSASSWPTLPLARLKETTQGRLRLGAHRGRRLPHRRPGRGRGGSRLQQIPGVGPQTATQVIAAARQLDSAMTQSVRLRFDPDARPPLQTRLLAELHAYGVARQAVSPGNENLGDLAAALDGVLAGAGRAASRLRMFFSGSP